jgi:GNAT superfamily N-acetyltransferase
MTADATELERYRKRVTLADGAIILLRPIVPEDKAKLLEGFHRMSPESRYYRFMTTTEELTDEQLRYLTEIDYENHFALAAIVADAPGEPGIGVARYIRDTSDPEVAEPAIAVIDDWQGRGVGTILLRQLSSIAREHGIKRFRGIGLATNRKVIELMTAIGADVTMQPGGEFVFEVDLPSDKELGASTLYRWFREVAREVSVSIRNPVSRLKHPER